MPRVACNCFSLTHTKHKGLPVIHSELQDTECDAWKMLLDRIEVASESGIEEFSPFRKLSQEQRAKIVTLPTSISKLKNVATFNLYGSALVRIPPEIGEMHSLSNFTPYTSHLLHWFPYEITRCKKLVDSTISTRALYGNYKFRPPFPYLGRFENEESYPLITPINCSVCRTEMDQSNVFRRWISLRVATDVIPLLVNGCSEACIDSLPQTPDNYINGPHIGGHHIKQPPPR